MNRIHQTAALITLITTLVTTSSYAAADSHMQEVETLFRLTQMQQKVDESVDNIVQMQVQQSPALAQHRDKVHAFFQRYTGWEALKTDIANMYLENFSEEELRAINAFYITPAGQKVINVVPQLVQQRNSLVAQRLQQHIGELKQIIGQQPAK